VHPRSVLKSHPHPRRVRLRVLRARPAAGAMMSVDLGRVAAQVDTWIADALGGPSPG